MLKALNDNQREGMLRSSRAITQKRSNRGLKRKTTNEAVIFGKERNRRSMDEDVWMTRTAMFSKMIDRSIRGKGLEAKWRVVWAIEKRGHEQKRIFSGTNSQQCINKPSRP